MTRNEELPSLRVNVVENGALARKNWTNCSIGEHLRFSANSLSSYFFANWEPVVFDALLLAAAVEFCDRVKKRPKYGWGREITLRLPVHDVNIWRKKEVAASLLKVLEFLTGDIWHVEFTSRKKREHSPQQGLFQLPLSGELAVMPFSDGLDSRAVSGIVANKIGSGLIRVRLGTKSADRPTDENGQPLPFTNVPYKVQPKENTFPESSARSRGFKFALLSGIAAYLANAPKIIVPESGQGALGPTLVTVGQSYDDFRNHPAFTSYVQDFLAALLGKSIRFEFPRLWHTKGQTLKAYVSLSNSARWADTHSCWQDNRHASVDGKLRQCGICAACMLRQLSVHAAGLSEDDDTYVWNLKAKTFEDGVARGKKIEGVQRQYAIAGTLHLDHLAHIGTSSAHSHGIKTSASLLARSLDITPAEAELNVNQLLEQHQKEWDAFMNFLGPESFVRHWTESVK